MKTLRDVKVGESATVKKLHGEGATKRRIMDMGITKARISRYASLPPSGIRLSLPFVAMSCLCERQTLK